MKNLIIILFSILSYIENAQNTINLNEIYTDNLERNVVDIIDHTNIYVNDGDSQALFYYAIVPEDSILGTLILKFFQGEMKI